MEEARKIMQLGWVVPDLDEAMSQWLKLTAAGPFFTFRHVATIDNLHRGHRVERDHSLAIAYNGDVQIELIQIHDSNPSVYRDLYPDGAGGFHHVAYVSDDYDAEIACFASRGCEIAGSHRYGEARISYVDTSPALGFMTEIFERAANVTALFREMKAASDCWDGVTDPIRAMA